MAFVLYIIEVTHAKTKVKPNLDGSSSKHTNPWCTCKYATKQKKIKRFIQLHVVAYVVLNDPNVKRIVRTLNI